MRTNRRRKAKFTGRLWKGLPIKDAIGELIIIATDEDRKKAIPLNAEQCVLAQACKRMFGSSNKMEIWAGIAYVELRDENGKAYVERFEVDKTLRKAIVKFDLTGEFPASGFTLKPVPYSKTFEAMSLNNRCRKWSVGKHKNNIQNRKRKAAIVGERKPVPDGRHWRSGTGQVHFKLEPALS